MPTPTAPTSAPRALVDAGALVVGGGPVGSLAAALLNHRGIPVTLLERLPADSVIPASRSYSQGIRNRGLDVIKSIPHLFNAFSAASTERGVDHMSSISPDGVFSSTVSVIARAVAKDEDASSASFLRQRFLAILADFLKERTSVSTMYGAELRHIRFQPDGSMLVDVQKADGTTLQLNSRFIVACDGVRSSVVEKLRLAEAEADSHVSSSAGFRKLEYFCPAAGTFVKSIVIDPAFLAPFGLDADAVRNHWLSVKGQRESRPPSRLFSLDLFPLRADDAARLGGLLAPIMSPPNADLWKLRSVEEAYALFQENFPQLDVRKHISESTLREFISSEPIVMPPIARPASIAALVGDAHADAAKRGAVVVVGDAAHSFPPTLGMGLNIAFEDLSVLMGVIDAAASHTLIAAIATDYERARLPDIEAIMYINRVAVLTFRRARLVSVAKWLNVVVRRALAKAAPGLFYPSITEMLALPLPYREMKRRADCTTRRLLGGLVALVGVPVLKAVLGLRRQGGVEE